MIEFTRQFERKKLESGVMVLLLSNVNNKDMRQELARVDWKGKLATKTVEQQCNMRVDSGPLENEAEEVMTGNKEMVEELN
eukprot:g44705.t1